MRSTVASLPICEVCALRRAIMLRALPGVGDTVPVCRPCHDAGAIPLEVAVAHTAAMHGMDRAAPWWHYLIHDTLEHLRTTMAEFEALVAEATAGAR